MYIVLAFKRYYREKELIQSSKKDVLKTIDDYYASKKSTHMADSSKELFQKMKQFQLEEKLRDSHLE